MKKRRRGLGGRQRKGGEREPAGRVQRKTRRQEEAEARDAAVWKLRRQWQIPEGEAVEMATGQFGLTYWGRLKKMGEKGGGVSVAQARAGDAWAQAVSDYLQSIGSRPVRSASEFMSSRGYDGADGTDAAYVEWCRRVKARHDRYRRAILECGDPFALFSMERIILEGRIGGPDAVGSVRCGCNAINRVDNPGGRG